LFSNRDSLADEFHYTYSVKFRYDYYRVQIHRVTCPYLDLRVCRASESGGDVLVCLPTDGSSTLRFRVSSGDRKKRVFRGVEELIDKRPLCVRAIGVSADLNLPAAVLKVLIILTMMADIKILYNSSWPDH